jgi:hypothetical protein
VVALQTPHANQQPLYRVLGLLDGVRKQGGGYVARCPGPRHTHGDRHPSLGVTTGQDGRVLLTCRTGCATEDVLAHLGLTWTDLYERNGQGHPIRRFKLHAPNGQTVEHVREDAPDGKKLWWETNGRKGLDRADDLAADTAAPVIVCEGEKSADALADLGLLAVATVTGAAATPSAAALAPLQGREVWLWPDNDDEGRDHMRRIAAQLRPTPKWIDWKDAPAKGDAADYAATPGASAGGVRALVQIPAAEPAFKGIRIWTATELARATFKEPKWAIPDLLPAGLAILAGRPKLGKSWLALGWAIDIPLGSPVLRKIDAPRGETLYLALEDGPRRMQERMTLMLGEAKAPPGFHVATEWPRTNEGGIDLLHEWLTKHPAARLVVVDTFKRVRPIEKNSQRLYDLDYDAIQPLAQLALEHNIAILPVFHTRKGESTDPLEMVSGTLGLSGAADCVMVLRRERGQADASLFVTGRDVEEQDLALRWERQDVLGWALLGDAEQFRRSQERQAILGALAALPGSGPTELAGALGKSTGSVRYLLFQMVRSGEVRSRDGKYWPTSTISPNANTPNAPSQMARQPLTPPVSASRERSTSRGVRGVSDDEQEREPLPWREVQD